MIKARQGFLRSFLCSTPDGINVFVTYRCYHYVAPAKLCSTPDGINVFVTYPHRSTKASDKLCSTPDGINVFVTPQRPGWPLGPPRAQRLTASTYSSRQYLAIDRIGHAMCSTPDGINVFVTRTGLGVNLSDLLACSTPDGINVFVTFLTLSASKKGMSAQRLTASTYSSRDGQIATSLST